LSPEEHDRLGMSISLNLVRPWRRGSVKTGENQTQGETTMKLYTQLNFGGNCEEAFRFYEKHLGGKITIMMNQSQAPGAPSGAGKAIIHARMNIGDTELIANDVPSSVFKKMRSVYLYLSVDSAKEAERVHKLLAEGGEIYMPMEETFYATRFSMLRDRFGVSWSVIHERPRQ
jgi:PhnB protein